MAGHIDFTRNNKIDIDNLLDVVCSTQHDAGRDVSLKEAKFNVMGMKVKNNDNYKNDNDEEGGCSKSKCGSCASKCGHHKPDVEHETDYNIWDPSYKEGNDEDDDDLYICDYCNRIGYSLRYVPDICDDCNSCEQCGKYTREECDGCSYSQWRDGKRYGDTLSMEEALSEYDVDIINSIGKVNYDMDDRLTTTRFSIRKK